MSNVGATPIELGGIELRDNAGQIALPHLVLPAGRSIVVAGSAAEIGDALAERVATGLFNGLGNSGDRLSLVAGDGQILDAISYGTDATFNAPPLSAPGPGHSLQRRFAADGTLLGIELAADPSPGRIEAPASGQTEALSGAASSAAGAAPPSANELRDGAPCPSMRLRRSTSTTGAAPTAPRGSSSSRSRSARWAA